MKSARAPERRVARSSAPSHGGRPSRAESEQISARILNAAKTLFLHDGYEKTSMDAIAAELGISKRTLYSRFSNKADLFEAVVVEVLENNLSVVTAVDVSGKPLRQQLLVLAERFLAITVVPDIIALERVVIGESRQFPQLAELIYEHGGDRLLAPISAVLRNSDLMASVSEADVRRDAEIFLSIVILQPLRKAVLQRTKPGLDGVDRAFLDRSINIFVTGMSVLHREGRGKGAPVSHC